MVSDMICQYLFTVISHTESADLAISFFPGMKLSIDMRTEFSDRPNSDSYD